MKKLSKMVLLLGSVFLLTLFASCSNGSSSDDSRESDTLLAGKKYYDSYFTDTYIHFNEDGKTYEIKEDGNDELRASGTYTVSDGEIGGDRNIYLGTDEVSFLIKKDVSWDSDKVYYIFDPNSVPNRSWGLFEETI